MSVEMKDSGIAWLGKIPKHWNRISLKFLCQISTGDKDTVNKIDDGLYPFFVRSPQIERINSYTYDGEAILMAGDGVGAGRVFHYFCGKFDFHQRVYNLHNIQGAKGKFLYYYLSSNFYKLMDAGSAKSTVDSVRLPMLKVFPVVVPTIEEQSLIANFLDNKCAEIDELIALQEQMIAQLNTYKQAVITETVTKGLDPNVKMKDSGVEWIGEIPEHWDSTKTLNLLSMPITDGPHETPTLYAEGIPFISAEAVSGGEIDFSKKRGYVSEEFYKECCKKYVPQLEDIYMIKSGASTGRVAIVKTIEIFTIWSPLAVFRANRNIIKPNYMYYALKSNSYLKQVENNWSYGTQQNIGMRVLEKLIIAYPPLSEQQTIANYLDQKCKEIDELISIKKEKIEHLKAYKKSVIYEYVTGKKHTN